jgi:hypothetical protein
MSAGFATKSEQTYMYEPVGGSIDHMVEWGGFKSMSLRIVGLTFTEKGWRLTGIGGAQSTRLVACRVLRISPGEAYLRLLEVK